MFINSKNSILLKKGIFSVELLFSLPGTSFFLSLSANTKTFSVRLKGLLKDFFSPVYCLIIFVISLTDYFEFFST